jgi:hypothetical protein
VAIEEQFQPAHVARPNFLHDQFVLHLPPLT